jgi:4-hydroxy-tetrahydrodipicolinate reductase
MTTSGPAPAPTRVAVIGAKGRMGQAVCAAVEAAPDLELGPRVDVGDDVEAVGSADVAVVFSTPDVAVDHVLACVRLGVHAVVGTTGWTPERLDRVRDGLAGRGGAEGADEAGGVGVLVAPNFALGAVLLMRFAALAAPHYESVEIVELHHPDKVDAPSGTARHTAELVAAARLEAGSAPIPDATSTSLDGARGADVDGVRVHSVRLRGLVAHEEVLLGAPGEQLTLRHDSFDRASFMPGVLLGVRRIADRPGLTVGLEHLLEL